MSAAMPDGSHHRTQVPRSIRSRLLGTTGIPFPLPFGVVFVFVVAHGLVEGTSNIPPHDRLSPVGAAITIAVLSGFALGGIALGSIEWRRSLTLTDSGVEIHDWRQHFVPWADVKAIQFRQISMGRGTAPGAELVHHDGHRTELRALLQAGRRTRQRQVDVLTAACARHGIDVCSDGSWWWRRIDLHGEPGGLRAAHC
jgi:hypothetical protein